MCFEPVNDDHDRSAAQLTSACEFGVLHFPIDRPRATWLGSVSRGVGGLLVLAIIVLTVVPPSVRPETPLPHVLEHALIFLITGFVLGIGYTGRERELCLGAVVFCTAIEVSQLFVPGRHARLVDFITDLLASLAGIWVASIVARVPLPQRVRAPVDPTVP